MSSSSFSDLPSSTVMTPSLPTFSIASAMRSPIDESELAEIEPTWAISLVVVHGRAMMAICSTVAATALSMPRFRSIGFMPAATNFMPSRTMACASTVAVVVPSPATSEVLDATSFTICAPIFSNLSLSSISLATDTPSLVTVGAPNERSSTTLRPFGPSVTLTALARMLTPSTILARAASPKITSLAAMLFLLNSVDKCTNGCQLLDDDRHDVFFAHDHQFLAVHFDGLAGVFAEQDAVAYFDIQRTDFAVVEDFAIADGQDFALIRFFGGCVRNDQVGGSFGFLVEAFDDDAIVQRAKVHKNSLFNGGGAKAMTAPAYRPRLQTSCRCNQFATASKSC